MHCLQVVAPARQIYRAQYELYLRVGEFEGVEILFLYRVI